MDKETRNAIERATQQARALLEEDFAEQLEGTFDILRSGLIAASAGAHLTPRQRFHRDKIVAAIEHKQAGGMSAAEAVADYLRDAAFTTLNRFVALKMLEARELVQECITKGEQSAGYREFCGMAPAVRLLPDSAGYRLYLESLFDELSTEIKVLFDRRESVVGAVAQAGDLRRAARSVRRPRASAASGARTRRSAGSTSSSTRRGPAPDARRSQAPRNSRELAVRNQFFTPSYVVHFLADNTLGDLWCEMRRGRSELRERCRSIIARPYGPEGDDLGRGLKDPRDLRVLDPACGSGHFLLAAFDLFYMIYEEAWADPASPASQVTGRSLRADYPQRADLHARLPLLILKHNLWGIDVDPRCAQIAALALWMRAQRAFRDAGIPRAEREPLSGMHLIVAEPLPRGDDRAAFLARVDRPLRPVAEALFERMELAGEAGALLSLEDVIRRGGTCTTGASGSLFLEADETCWSQTVAALHGVLEEFTSDARPCRQPRRSLFADDVKHGLAFVEATRQTYDVVLMNPPFGDPPKGAKEVSGPELASSSNDLGAAFVQAAQLRWAPAGRIGVLASTALWFKPTVARWRASVLLADDHAIQLAAHLGGGVLDGATVSASAVVLDRRLDSVPATFVRLLREEAKGVALGSAIAALQAGTAHPLVFRVDVRALRAYRGCPLAYWISGALRESLTSFPALEGTGADVQARGRDSG